MFQVLSLIFLAVVVSTIWGTLDFDEREDNLFLCFKNGIYAFFGLIGMTIGLGLIISLLS